MEEALWWVFLARYVTCTNLYRGMKNIGNLDNDIFWRKLDLEKALSIARLCYGDQPDGALVLHSEEIR